MKIMLYLSANRDNLKDRTIPECIVSRYDSQGRPVYRNIYFHFLLEDEITLPGLKCLAVVGLASNMLPHELNASLLGYLCNSLGGIQSPLESMRRTYHPNYATKRMRLTALKDALIDKKIEPTKDGWIGFEIDSDGSRVKAARITRVGDAISTEVEYFQATKWDTEELQILRMSNEYRRTLVWLYDNMFLHS